MKESKRILSVLFVLLILIMSAPAAFSADVVASGTCGPNATWSIDENRVLTISGTGAVTSSDYISSPYSSGYDRVVIENGITEISTTMAFSLKGVRLSSISIPPSLKKMGHESICETEFDSVYITDMAAWCSIVHEGSNTNPLWNNSKLYLNGTLVSGDYVFPNTISEINAGSFCYYDKLTGVTIPGTVKTVGFYDADASNHGPYGVFRGCENLEHVVLQSGVQAVGAGAFDGCANLSSVELPNTLQTIQVGAFADCPNLSSVELPNTLQTIQVGAFADCPKIKHINIPKSVQSIQFAAFYNSGLTEVKIWNPSCEIADDYIIEPNNDWEEMETLTVFPSDITIYGYKNSSAETYAKTHNCTFVELDEPTHSHQYTATIATPATCTQKGVMTYTCSCGDTYTEEIPIDPTNHAALNENGDCPRCGNHVKDVEKPIEPATQPSEEKPHENLNIFQRIIQWFRNLFAKLFGR